MSTTVTQVIQKAFLHAQGKSTAPTVGTNKYTQLLNLVDSLQKMWASEPDTEWNSLYSLVTTATASATDTFDLDDSIDYISKREGDYIRVTNTTNTTAFKLISPNQLYDYRFRDAAAQVGRTLVFSRAFKSTDSTFGYNIIVPAILYTDDITTGTQTVQVDDPMWLAYMVAAEYVANNLIKATQRPRLLELADQLMQRMKQANGGQYETVASNWIPEGETWV